MSSRGRWDRAEAEERCEEEKDAARGDGRRRDEGQATSATADVASCRKIESPDPALPGSGAGAARAGGAGADPAALARARRWPWRNLSTTRRR
jgi:hypothetical protein